MAAAAKFGMFGALWKWGLGALLVVKKLKIIAVAGALGCIVEVLQQEASRRRSG